LVEASSGIVALSVVLVSDKEEPMEKNNRRPKKLALKVETLRRLEADQLEAVEGGGTFTIATIIFSEGACEGYSWARSC
jgi:hypothetical protein